MDRYLREETNIDEDDEPKKMLLQSSIANIKRNTREIEPDSDFTAKDFCLQAIVYIQSVLNRRVDIRVDQMVQAGLVEEVWQIFIPDANYTKGIQLSIGILEMDRYLREVINIDEDDESKMLLQSSIANIKCNTRLLICHEFDKIQRLIYDKMWLVHHIIATYVFKGDRKYVVDEAWRNTIFQPRLDIV
ncbi:hypothetical protein MTR67_018510 [Solanum verrucosum]|uniref:Uncharacterized protein n=1 Tax=Solanum verrucosum TaxID=315347 RepID=A0AAF0QPX3_SOLVR|nr:hypothetical protein MTR67_018510 [Solanum verrucosum]